MSRAQKRTGLMGNLSLGILPDANNILWIKNHLVPFFTGESFGKRRLILNLLVDAGKSKGMRIGLQLLLLVFRTFNRTPVASILSEEILLLLHCALAVWKGCAISEGH